MICSVNCCKNDTDKLYCQCQIPICDDHLSQYYGIKCSICSYGQDRCLMCSFFAEDHCNCIQLAYEKYNFMMRANYKYTDICVDIIRYEWEVYKQVLTDEPDKAQLMDREFYVKYNSILTEKQQHAMLNTDTDNANRDLSWRRKTRTRSRTSNSI